jgi:hypothetical protein
MSGENDLSAFSDLPALSWVYPRGVREFYCDAFLSHRRNDASESLAAALSEHGLRVWHDHHADLSHRRVRD